MKFSTVIIYIILCYYVQYGLQEENIMEEDNQKLKILLDFLENDIWDIDTTILDITYVYSGKKTKLQKIINKLQKTNCELNYNNKLYSVFELSKEMYIALECKFSNAMITSLIYFFHSCNKNEFSHLKNISVGMIHNLFSFKYLFPNLNSIDQTLLLSLISIYMNIFHLNTIEFDKNIAQIAIAQMVNWIENFRCINCVVSDYDYYSNYHNLNENTKFEKFKTILEEHKRNSENGIGIKSLNYDKEYDPKMLVLGQILEMYPDIGQITIKWNNSSELLNEIQEKAVKSHNVLDILNCQIALIEVIKDLFYMKFLKMDGEKFKLFNLSKYKKILKAFDVYIEKIIPNNYPPNLYDPIIAVKRAIQSYIKTKKSFIKETMGMISLRSQMKNLLQVNTIVDKDTASQLVRSIKITSFIKNIVEHKYFRTFYQTFQIFLSYPNIIENYQIKLSFKSNANREPSKGQHCAMMPVLRENLFLYRSLLAGKHQAYHQLEKTNGPDFATLSSMDLIKKSLACVYTKCKENDEILKIIAPITIHFNDATYSSKECMLSKQYLLLTVNLIESYEIHNCAGPIKFNLNMYQQILNKKKILKVVPEGVRSPADFNTQYIHKLIIKKTKEIIIRADRFNEDVYDCLSWVNVLIPNGYFYFYDSKFNSDRVFWYGTVQNINNVSKSITQYVFDLEYIAKYYIFILKWSIGNIFKKMAHIVQNIRSLETILPMINNNLNQLTHLPFPKRSYINTYISTILSVYNLICSLPSHTNSPYDAVIIENGTNTINDQILLLNVFDKNDSLMSMESTNVLDIRDSILNDITFLTEILKFLPPYVI